MSNNECKRNREIKFRVPFITRGFAYFESLEEITQEEYTSHNYIWDEAQQFTGLKDKNGKEIYEGDIVKDDYYGIGQVMWSDTNYGCVPGWEICNKEGFSKEIYYGAPPSKNSQIIGNIYETLKLMEK